MEELAAEKAKNKQQSDRFNEDTIRVTGPGGSPLYAWRYIDALKEQPYFADPLFYCELRGRTRKGIEIPAELVDASLLVCPVQTSVGSLLLSRRNTFSMMSICEYCKKRFTGWERSQAMIGGSFTA